ncbi:unnamed protein product [Sphagnum troendelagicum]
MNSITESILLDKRRQICIDQIIQVCQQAHINTATTHQQDHTTSVKGAVSARKVRLRSQDGQRLWLSIELESRKSQISDTTNETKSKKRVTY